MRRLNLISASLTLACLACAAAGQIVIPPGVYDKIPPKKVKPKTPATAPAGKKVDIQRLIINFRQAAGNGPKREAAAAELLKLGPRGAKLLRNIVAAELPRRTAGYKKAFYAQARRIAAAKLRKTGSAKIEKWREQFDSTGSITKDSLKAKAGPAMDALLEALVPKRQEVLDTAKTLTARREELVALDSIRGKCAAELKTGAAASDFPKTLEQQESLISLMSTSMSQTDRKSIETDMKKFARMGFEEWHAFVHLNVVRILLGKRPMRIDLKLSAAGRDHSKDMSHRKFFSHTSPVAGKKTPWDRAKRQGTKANGECIAAGVSSGPRAIRMWFFSPGHHKIIMSGASRVGIGNHSRTWTLMTG